MCFLGCARPPPHLAQLHRAPLPWGGMKGHACPQGRDIRTTLGTIKQAIQDHRVTRESALSGIVRPYRGVCKAYKAPCGLVAGTKLLCEIPMRSIWLIQKGCFHQHSTNLELNDVRNRLRNPSPTFYGGNTADHFRRTAKHVENHPRC